MIHELVDAFRAHDLTLRRTFQDMLNELPAHRTERRGCGFTQATRFLSTYINAPGASDDPSDLQIFEDWPPRGTPFAAATAMAAGWPHGWRRLDEFEPHRHLDGAQFNELMEALTLLRHRFRAAVASLALPESHLIATLMAQILDRDGDTLIVLPPMPVKPNIGSCSQAEEFFLEISHGRVRRGGSVNVFVDDDGSPVLVEKMNLGESHSAVVLAPVRLNGVVLPPGSLCALAHDDPDTGRATEHGRCYPLATITQTRFLRLTTLAVEAAHRRRVFSCQLDAQQRAGMFSPATTTLAELRAFAAAETASRR
ncbi:MAG TPA: hypothetical protein VLF18_06350 [Tahibacter sp.]|uniref:hypothetical protein n=1 Tax=Tahibacter sp. TaxID=2056211 RepID=UPI002C37B59B|nr:hypothetical protein [Tahibacter sp.]HSX59801.1 hypothetical protein [Tahibacter sp.]